MSKIGMYGEYYFRLELNYTRTKTPHFKILKINDFVNKNGDYPKTNKF